MAVRLQEAAVLRLDEIYRYSRERWREAQAKDYIDGFFAAFEKIADGRAIARPIPAPFGVKALRPIY